MNILDFVKLTYDEKVELAKLHLDYYVQIDDDDDPDEDLDCFEDDLREELERLGLLEKSEYLRHVMPHSVFPEEWNLQTDKKLYGLSEEDFDLLIKEETEWNEYIVESYDQVDGINYTLFDCTSPDQLIAALTLWKQNQNGNNKNGRLQSF